MRWNLFLYMPVEFVPFDFNIKEVQPSIAFLHVFAFSLHCSCYIDQIDSYCQIIFKDLMGIFMII